MKQLYIVAALNTTLLIALHEHLGLGLVHQPTDEDSREWIELDALHAAAPNPLTLSLWQLSHTYTQAPIEAFRAVAEANKEAHRRDIQAFISGEPRT